jgi:hypothetical protein
MLLILLEIDFWCVVIQVYNQKIVRITMRLSCIGEYMKESTLKNISASSCTSSFSNKDVHIDTSNIFIDKGAPLPMKYNVTEIVVLVRDPECVFTCWEISDDKKNELKSKFGENIFQISRCVLKINDVTGIEYNGLNENDSFCMDVYPDVMNWYLKISDKMRRDICVEIGLLVNDKFISIAKSNIVTMPSSSVCTEDESITYSKDWLRRLSKYLSGSSMRFLCAVKDIVKQDLV